MSLQSVEAAVQSALDLAVQQSADLAKAMREASEALEQAQGLGLSIPAANAGPHTARTAPWPAHSTMRSGFSASRSSTV